MSNANDARVERIARTIGRRFGIVHIVANPVFWEKVVREVLKEAARDTPEPPCDEKVKAQMQRILDVVMSAKICPDCRARYLPIEGACLCRELSAQ